MTHTLIDLEFKPYRIGQPKPVYPGQIATQFRIDDHIFGYIPEKHIRNLLRYQKVVKDDRFCNEPVYEDLPEDQWTYTIHTLNFRKRKTGEDYRDYNKLCEKAYSPDYFENNLFVGPEVKRAEAYNKWINEIQPGDFVKCKGQRNPRVWKMIITIDPKWGTFTNMQFTKPINDTKYAHSVGTENSIYDIKEKYQP